MEIQRKQTETETENVFTLTSGGFKIAVRNNSFTDSKEHSLEPT